MHSANINMSGTAQNDQKFKNDLVRLGKAHILTSVQDTIQYNTMLTKFKFKPNFLNCTDLRNYYISNSVSILLLHIFKHNLVITTDLKMTYNSQLHI